MKLSIFVILSIVSCENVENCKNRRLLNPYNYIDLHVNQICHENRQWFVYRLREWRFAKDQLLSKYFPIDKETRNYVRQVKEAAFSIVYPTPLSINAVLAATSDDVLIELLDIDPLEKTTETFVQLVNGVLLVDGVLPLAHRYGGHQFGYWSGQLGDGRAAMLGEYVNHQGERWELQLKGSGLTPYSRRGDGKAVIRSSVREFLCSEAMQALGIPTSRAASLVVSDDPVTRDQFYNGNIQEERAAIVLHLAKSWLRFGSLEILAMDNETELLRSMVKFIVRNYFEHIRAEDPDHVLNLFQEVVKETADMVALWQSVGFVHGVCNTDNFSILSITIDYGPFGFLESYDPGFVPNTSDDEGRYSYENQPDIGVFNLNKLRLALLPLLNNRQAKQMNTIMKSYAGIYKSKFMELLMRKLGFDRFTSYTDDDEQFIAILLKIMEDTKADFTMTFRELGELTLEQIDTLINNIDSHSIADVWAIKDVMNHEWFEDWFKVYKIKLKEMSITDLERQAVMLKTNPRYILRNWIAQVAIRHTERNDFTEVKSVLDILKNPYTYNKVAEEKGFAKRPPDWAAKLKVSCSS